MTVRGKRALSLLGMFLLADGSASMLNPASQLRLWSGPRAPRWYRRAMSYFGDHINLFRAISAAEIAAGIAALTRSHAR